MTRNEWLFVVAAYGAGINAAVYAWLGAPVCVFAAVVLALSAVWSAAKEARP